MLPNDQARPCSWLSFGGNIVSGFVSPAWMPSSLREAARAGDATPGDLESGAAWAHLLAKLQEASATVGVTTLVTALAVNYVHRGTYLP